MIETVATVASAVIAALALFGWHMEWRARQLRREEVLTWANEAIEALQSIYLVCALDENRYPANYLDSKVADLIYKTSILVEQGRLFFRNIIRDTHGAKKPIAYRGYRPRILDHLVIGHQIACTWKSADQAKRRKMAVIAETSVREFVSLVRDEVGRDKTASGGAAIHGYGVDLTVLLENVTESQIRDRKWL